MMDDDSAKELREAIHDLHRKVILARIEAMVTDSLEERMVIAATCLDMVETVLDDLEML